MAMTAGRDDNVLAQFLASGMRQGEAYYHWNEPGKAKDVPWKALTQVERNKNSQNASRYIKEHPYVRGMIGEVTDDIINDKTKAVRLAITSLVAMLQDPNLEPKLRLQAIKTVLDKTPNDWTDGLDQNRKQDAPEAEQEIARSKLSDMMADQLEDMLA